MPGRYKRRMGRILQLYQLINQTLQPHQQRDFTKRLTATRSSLLHDLTICSRQLQEVMGDIEAGKIPLDDVQQQALSRTIDAARREMIRMHHLIQDKHIDASSTREEFLLLLDKIDDTLHALRFLQK